MERISDRCWDTRVEAVVLDFDGTLSTLRCGWERVMQPLFCSFLAPFLGEDEARREVDRYIDESTGIQTIWQMKWLAEQVAKHGGQPLDPWAYKAMYNERLMARVGQLRRDLTDGRIARERYLVAGAERFLRGLRARGVRLFAASGTDQADVRAECAALGLDGYFEAVEGALPGSESCSKEAALRRLTTGLAGERLAVVGDGKVEILLGREWGARTLGVASDEVNGGESAQKRARLIRAGADALTSDFTDADAIYAFFGLDPVTEIG